MPPHHHHPFQASFWSPTASIEAVPDFTVGFQVLHKKLDQSKQENAMIVDYVKERIEAEKSHAAVLLGIQRPEFSPEESIESGLKKCFDMVRFESEASAKEHQTRAEDLLTTVLDPLTNFFQRYDRIRSQTKGMVETSISDFNIAVKLMDQLKLTYTTKCKALLIVAPDFNVQNQVYYKVGKSFQFATRDQVSNWFNQVVPSSPISKESLFNVMQQQSLFKQEEEESKQKELQDILDDLIQLEYLKEDNDTFIKVDQPNTKKSSGFFSTTRWNSQQRKDDLLKEMLDADRMYRQSVKRVEKLRINIEEILFTHYEEMESLELERIQTIKQAFIGIAASLSNTIPRCKETFDHMMLYQETLKPDKEVQSIVEQYRTGQFLPKSVLYQNFFYGASKDQVFGVPLEEISKVQGSLVPPLISEGLSVIESGFSNLCEEEKNVVWIKSLPLETIHKARGELNTMEIPITKEILKKYDLLLLASVIRLYLLELPECLFTFEFYDPCKLLYNSHQDEDSRLISISKLLATLPTSNYHTIMALFGHFHKLISSSQITVHSISKAFSHILARPQVETKLSLHERHSQKLLQDLIEHYEVLFTKDLIQLQEKNSNRPHMVVPVRKSSVDSARTSTSSSLKSFMKHSHSTPTTTVSSMNGSIRMPSTSTLFEDPDESFISSPVLTKEPHTEIEELNSLDSFFEDDD